MMDEIRYSLFAARVNDREYTRILRDRPYADIAKAIEELSDEWFYTSIRNDVYYTPPLYNIRGSTSYMPEYIAQRS